MAIDYDKITFEADEKYRRHQEGMGVTIAIIKSDTFYGCVLENSFEEMRKVLGDHIEDLRMAFHAVRVENPEVVAIYPDVSNCLDRLGDALRDLNSGKDVRLEDVLK